VHPNSRPIVPPRQSNGQFLGHFLLGGVYLEVYLVVLDRLLMATTKKRSSTVLRKKMCTPDKILATPMSQIHARLKVL